MIKNGKFKIHWLTQEHNLVGNAFGYNTHNRFMRKYCSQIMDFDESARIALQITPADKFRPVQGKFNILFTMWEFLDLPTSYISNINLADAIVVPSRFCKDLFKQYTNNPVEVCWEGIEAELFPYYERKFITNGQRFRFLWVGAPNPRKGYPLILEAIKVIEQIPNIEIYIKTTMHKINWKNTLKSIWKNRKRIIKTKEGRLSLLRTLRRIPRKQLADKIKYYGRYKNIIFDTRKLPFEELVNLYNSAHCFLLPTFGEGWGLTLCEAMATGAPCIATAVTGCADFFDENVGYPLAYEIKEQRLTNYDLKTRGYVPDTRDLIKKMVYVISHYKEALKKGRRASDRIRKKFTWEQSAKRLDEIIRKVINAN